MIQVPSARPTINNEDLEAVQAQLRSGHLEEGDTVREFECGVADLIGHSHAQATVNGFAAIHTLLLALDIQAGDEVIVPSYSCPALLYPVLLCGAQPVFADVGRGTFSIDGRSVARVRTNRTRAVILAYLFGFPSDADELMSAADGLVVIEDIAQAFGGSLRGRRLGSRAPYSVSSFYSTKMITSGDGGMIITSDHRIRERCRELVYYGGRRGHQATVFNYRLTNLNAALGLSQLRRIDEFIETRRSLAKVYDEAIEETDCLSRPFRFLEESAYLRYPILLPNAMMRDSVRKDLANKGFATGLGVLEGLRTKNDPSSMELPGTQELLDRLICLPIYPTLSTTRVRDVADALNRSVNRQ